jgi:hypothetical protein
LSTGDTPAGKDIHSLKVKGWKTIHQASGSQTQAGVTVLIKDKIHIKPKLEDTKGVSIQ